MQGKSEFIQAEGVYAIPRKDDKIVFIGTHTENLGKLEGSITAQELFPIVAGMFELVTGKIDDGEEPTDTVIREVYEERGVRIVSTDVNNSLPTATILQQRGSNQRLSFTVHGHSIPLTEQQISHIHQSAPTWEVAVTRLDDFIQNESSILRPSVREITRLLLEHKKNGGRL